MKKIQQFPFTPRASPFCHKDLVTQIPVVISSSPAAATSPLGNIFEDGFDLGLLYNDDYLEILSSQPVSNMARYSSPANSRLDSFSMDIMTESRFPKLDDKEKNIMDSVAEPRFPMLKNEEQDIDAADFLKTIAVFMKSKVTKLDQYKAKGFEPPAKRQRNF